MEGEPREREQSPTARAVMQTWTIDKSKPFSVIDRSSPASPGLAPTLLPAHPASLYEAFEPAEARRIAERLEIHYTPKHGSWLNMAGIEIGALVRQCLNRRIPDQGVLRREAAAWQNQRNRDGIRVDWRFTTADARIKLKSLYPSLQY